EAKWYNQGHKPKLDEYLDNAWMSSSGHVFMTNAYCMSDNLTKESLESFSTYPKIELERGDAPSSIQCYMLESGVPETAARKKIRELIKTSWRGINGDRSSSSGEIFKTVAVGLPRTSQFMYQHGDGYGAPDGETKEQIMSLLFEPLQL
ncbi:hypothetical protein GW17_00049504, partial [Ensete ventricosum]